MHPPTGQRLALRLLLLAACGVACSGPELSSVREGPRELDPLEHGIGTIVPDLPFTDLDGRRGRLSDHGEGKALVVAMTSVTCPISKKLAPKLVRLSNQYGERGIDFLLLNASEADSSEEMRAAVTRYGFDVPYIPDDGAAIARGLGARTTTDVFVLDPSRMLVYRGAVDDQYGFGYARAEPRHAYLVDALDALLAGRPPDVEATSSPGCVLPLGSSETRVAAGGDVTYHGRVAHVVQERCVACHREGQAAPFPLRTYEDVRGRRRMIREVLERRIMPPWFADPAHGEWANDARLTDEEHRDVLAWIAAGSPEGDPSDAPPPKVFSSDWAIGEPDLLLEIPKAMQVPAEGVVPYQLQWIDTGLTEDRWVKAIEIRPTVAEAVHHVLLFAIYPDDHPRKRDEPKVRSGQDGHFAAFAPGQPVTLVPEGTGKFLPRGARFKVQLHYTPFGEPVVDRTRVAIAFHDERPTREVRTLSASSQDFAIPARTPDFPVRSEYVFDRPGAIHSFFPHLHLRGKSFRYDLIEPDGARRTLLSVPRYDFNWQLRYTCKEPIDVQPGSRLVAEGRYDNSAANPANPDPDVVVTYGPQTWHEMMIGYFDFVAADRRRVTRR